MENKPTTKKKKKKKPGEVAQDVGSSTDKRS
jgi:hypothetical protein